MFKARYKSQQQIVSEVHKFFRSELEGHRKNLKEYKKTFLIGLSRVDSLRENEKKLPSERSNFHDVLTSEDIENSIFNDYEVLKKKVEFCETLVSIFAELKLSPLKIYQVNFVNRHDGNHTLNFYVPDDKLSEHMIGGFIFSLEEGLLNEKYTDFIDYMGGSLREKRRLNDEVDYEGFTSNEAHLLKQQSLRIEKQIKTLDNVLHVDSYNTIKNELIYDYLTIGDFLVSQTKLSELK